MVFDFDKIKNKITESVADVKKSDTFKKVSETTKDVAGKVKEKAENIDTDKIKDKLQDIYEDTKRTIRRAGDEISDRIDKLKR